MWIRSQCKTVLMDARRFQVDNNKIYTFDELNEDGFIMIGEYKSKERALEVLDDIQLEIKSYNPDNNVYIMMEE